MKRNNEWKNAGRSTVRIGSGGFGNRKSICRSLRLIGRSAKSLHGSPNPRGLVVRESTGFFASDDALITLALEFIAARSHLPIGPNDVARAVATGTRTLQRRFRERLGRPIASEIRRVRIERAKRELTESTRAMSEIARTVGFGHAMRMCEVFRREVGITPSEYRRQRQGRLP